jgi:hypothetical protein
MSDIRESNSKSQLFYESRTPDATTYGKHRAS